MHATTYEREVLVALNSLRANPQAYAEALVRFRANFHGTAIAYPGSPIRTRTAEGTRPLDTAVAMLRTRPRLALLSPSGLLADAARDHVHYQAGRGAVGHMEGRIGPGERLRARGGGDTLTEVIAYGVRDPADVIRQLIIDDGVSGRGHRIALLDPALRFAGVACGPHRLYQSMCVIDMSTSWNGGGRSSLTDWIRERARRFTLDR